MAKGHVGARIVWCRLDAKPAPIVVVGVYWPHHARKQAPYRDDTADELQQLLKRIVGT